MARHRPPKSTTAASDRPGKADFGAEQRRGQFGFKSAVAAKARRQPFGHIAQSDPAARSHSAFFDRTEIILDPNAETIAFPPRGDPDPDFPGTGLDAMADSIFDQRLQDQIGG